MAYEKQGFKKNETSGKPLETFRAGTVSATVWQNFGKNKDGKEFGFRTINVERNYKDKEDKWQKTSAMKVDDLPKVELVTRLAYEYCQTHSKDDQDQQ